MLHYCTEIASVRLREDAMVALKQRVYKYDNDKKMQKVGDAFIRILQDTSEPGRIWIGNMSSDQIAKLQELVTDKTVASFTQAQLTNTILEFSRVLSVGALSINQHRIIKEQNLPQDTELWETELNTDNTPKTRGRPRKTDEAETLQNQPTPMTQKATRKRKKATSDQTSAPEKRPVGRPKGSVKSNIAKIVKNPKGREKYKAHPIPLTQVPPLPTILIQDLAEDTKIRYATAVRKGNNTLTELESITTISDFSIPAGNFLALHDNKKSIVIHSWPTLSFWKELSRTLSRSFPLWICRHSRMDFLKSMKIKRTMHSGNWIDAFAPKRYSTMNGTSYP
jgi:hypothetical protein